jgi:hypothetical protein
MKKPTPAARRSSNQTEWIGSSIPRIGMKGFFFIFSSFPWLMSGEITFPFWRLLLGALAETGTESLLWPFEFNSLVVESTECVSTWGNEGLWRCRGSTGLSLLWDSDPNLGDPFILLGEIPTLCFFLSPEYPWGGDGISWEGVGINFEGLDGSLFLLRVGACPVTCRVPDGGGVGVLKVSGVGTSPGVLTGGGVGVLKVSGVGTSPGVLVGLGVGVAVLVGLGVGVAVLVGLGVGVAVLVGLGVTVLVGLGVAVGLGVGVGCIPHAR